VAYLLITAVKPISVIHIDGDDDSDDVGDAPQLTDDDQSRQVSAITAPPCRLALLLPASYRL